MDLLLGTEPFRSCFPVSQYLLELCDIHPLFGLYDRHNMLQEGRTQPLYQYTMVLRGANGEVLRTPGNKIMYRCLACGWTGGSTTGIKSIQHHLLGNHQGGVQACGKSTPSLHQRLGVPLHEVGNQGCAATFKSFLLPTVVKYVQ